MRTKSIFGVKSITNLIYGLLMIAPFVAILSRVIYTQANGNAKDSYSGQQNDVYEYPLTMDDIQLNKIYHFSSIPTYTETSNQSSGYVIYENISNIETTNQTLKNALLTGYSFQYYARVDQRQIYVYDNENNTITAQSVFNQSCTFDFQLKGFNDYTFTNTLKSFSILRETNNSYMDNAFEYSLSSFTKDNDIGVINFFGWFEGMFLNQSNVHNMVYLNFANWYMNYALLVSSSYLLFLALIWFVNYIRRILDKSMNQEFGGF